MGNSNDKITKKEKLEALNKILNSEIFKESKKYKELLKYLVECSLKNIIPKETTIAIDVFGKDTSFNSDKDATVRYHIYNLRKKLSKYYETEGKGDKICVSVPRGRYEVIYYYKPHIYLSKLSSIIKPLKDVRVVLILLLVILNSALVLKVFYGVDKKSIYPERHVVSKNDPIWVGFFENKLPIIMVIGDDFMMDEYNERLNRYRQVRDWTINSEEELSEFLRMYPTEKLWESEITGVPFGAIYNLMDLLPILYQFTDAVDLKLSSEIKQDDLKKHNMIYIGELRNLRKLKKLFFRVPIRFQYHPEERLIILNDDGDTLQVYTRLQAPYEQKNKFNIDYSLLVKMPGLAGEVFMFIAGFGYPGRLERTKMLSYANLREDFINEIKLINDKVPDYFIALFEVKSIERTGFTNKLKYFRQLPFEFFFDKSY